VAGEGICIEGEPGTSCAISLSEVGCCVIEPGACLEETTSRGCFDTEHGIFWNPGESCSVVQECARNVPIFNEWGLIAMAGILGIIGFIVIRRRKVTA